MYADKLANYKSPHRNSPIRLALCFPSGFVKRVLSPGIVAMFRRGPSFSCCDRVVLSLVSLFLSQIVGRIKVLPLEFSCFNSLSFFLLARNNLMSLVCTTLVFGFRGFDGFVSQCLSGLFSSQSGFMLSQFIELVLVWSTLSISLMVGCMVSGFTGFSCVCLSVGLLCSLLGLVVFSMALFGWVPIGFGLGFSSSAG